VILDLDPAQRCSPTNLESARRNGVFPEEWCRLIRAEGRLFVGIWAPWPPAGRCHLGHPVGRPSRGTFCRHRPTSDFEPQPGRM